LFQRLFKIPLEGAELEEYVREKKEERVSKAGSEEDSESEDEDAEDAMNIDGGAGAAAPGFKRRVKLVPLYPMYCRMNLHLPLPVVFNEVVDAGTITLNRSFKATFMANTSTSKTSKCRTQWIYLLRALTQAMLQE
jgi:hypothetical protein